jgi:centromere protein C
VSASRLPLERAANTFPRRTGITLSKQRLDEHGIEEVTGVFSSTRKPSPLKNVINASGVTPPQALTTRKSVRRSIARSASPRKTGITGTARRSNGVDLRAVSKEPEVFDSEDRENENALPSSPSNRANHSARRYSGAADKTPLRDITTRNTPSSRERSIRDKLTEGQPDIAVPIEDEHGPLHEQSEEEPESVPYIPGDDEEGQVWGDDDGYEAALSEEPRPQFDDEDADQTFAPALAFPHKTTANSRRKRKSDLEVPSSPTAKRIRREGPKEDRKAIAISKETEVDSQRTTAESSKASSQSKPKQRGRPPPLKPKSTNTKATKGYPKQLDDVIEKVKQRPNPPKSLYILRRETPADDGVTLTRSGRMSFRPLAYWRNEQCVYGGSPSGAGLQDGARFPLNSVKEIIRTEEVVEPLGGRKKKKRKGKGRAARSTSRTADAELSESESDEERVDPDAEPWELEVGTFRGPVSVWDTEVQAPIDQEEEIEIAYAPAAIETSTVNVNSGSGPSFKYSKLLGNRFMGVGLVDLEPGGIKRPKNSRKMHMSFFVVKGRVTVSIGPAGGEETGSWSRFSIGKGGFWQVPRGKSPRRVHEPLLTDLSGNQYSIENELGKPARIFFSQGCEVSPDFEEED